MIRNIRNPIIRAVFVWLCFLTCLSGGAAWSQQVGGQVNAGIGGGSVSSMVQSRSDANRAALSGQSSAGQSSFGSGASSVRGFPSNSNSASQFSIKRSRFSGSGDGFNSSSMAVFGYRATGKNARTQSSRTGDSSSLSVSDGDVHELANGGDTLQSVQRGDFPDSTREFVWPTPPFGQNALHFLALRMPTFSPDFGSVDHLHPTYNVSAAGASSTQGNWARKSALTSGDTPGTLSPDLNITSGPDLGGNPIPDPLANQFGSLLNSNQPN